MTCIRCIRACLTIAGILSAVPALLAGDDAPPAVGGDPSASASQASPDEAASKTPPDPDVSIEKRLYTGRAVRLSDALKRRGIRSGPEMEGHVVLEMPDGTLIPILADWRGRAFYQDERLRDRRLTLVAHRRSDVGYLQPLMVFTYDEQGRPQFTDYWCDVCSIPMYEIKPCECCQGEIRLRFTLQEPPGDVPPADQSR